MTHKKTRFKDNFLQLTRYALLIFEAQPLRWYVHAFLLCGTTMELFVYGRSAVYSSGAFDIQDNPELFSVALVSYATMADENLGVSTYSTSSSIALPAVATGDVAIHTWTQDVLSQVTAIVSRAITCYKTTDGHVVKSSWTPNGTDTEARLLLLANAAGVPNIPKLLSESAAMS